MLITNITCRFIHIILHAQCKCNAYLRMLLIHNISITIALRGDNMSKFKIPSIPLTTNKTIRFPNDVIADVEEAIKGKECTFSAFVISAVRAVLEEIKENQ